MAFSLMGVFQRQCDVVSLRFRGVSVDVHCLIYLYLIVYTSMCLSLPGLFLVDVPFHRSLHMQHEMSG